jgi:hypothetical protein
MDPHATNNKTAPVPIIPKIVVVVVVEKTNRFSSFLL